MIFFFEPKKRPKTDPRRLLNPFSSPFGVHFGDLGAQEPKWANFWFQKGPQKDPADKAFLGIYFLLFLDTHLESSWGPLGALWASLGGLLGPSWGPFEPLDRGPFGPLLEPFWASQMDKDTQLLPRTAIFKMHCLALQISHKSTRK